MGWLGAANLLRHLHSELARLASAQLHRLAAPSWLGRASIPSGRDSPGRLVNFVRVYLDNWDHMRAGLLRNEAAESGVPGALQLALRQVFHEWGVAINE